MSSLDGLDVCPPRLTYAGCAKTEPTDFTPVLNGSAFEVGKTACAELETVARRHLPRGSVALGVGYACESWVLGQIVKCLANGQPAKTTTVFMNIQSDFASGFTNLGSSSLSVTQAWTLDNLALHDHVLYLS